MSTPEEHDYIGEVIREDAAMRCIVIAVNNVSSAMSTIDELRQQLADVSHERDLLRASIDRIGLRLELYLEDECEIPLHSIEVMLDIARAKAFRMASDTSVKEIIK